MEELDKKTEKELIKNKINNKLKLNKRLLILKLIKILTFIFFLNTICIFVILIKMIDINYSYNKLKEESNKDVITEYADGRIVNKKDYIYNNNHYNVKYIDNYDGDTATFEIKLYKKGTQILKLVENVRFKNINAEELRNKDINKKQIAIKQKEELKNKLQNAKQIDLLNCEKEKYGRLLCELSVL